MLATAALLAELLVNIITCIYLTATAIVLSQVLPAVDNDHWRLTYLNNINACIMFAPLVWWFERDALIEHFDTLLSPAFMVNMMLAGVFGFSIGIVTVMQIKATR
jgi:solute carrier family 35 (GDP-fucose transporter), member C1